VQATTEAQGVDASLQKITTALQRLADNSKAKAAAALRVLDEDSAAWLAATSKAKVTTAGDLDGATQDFTDNLLEEFKRRREGVHSFG